MRGLMLLAWMAWAGATVFQRQGPLHLTGGTYIVKLRLDLSGYHNHCDDFSDRTKGSMSKVSEPVARFALNQTILAMKDACKRAEYWPSRWGSERPRRQVGVLLAGAVFGGLISQLWEGAADHSAHVQGQLERVRKDLESLAESSAHIADVLHSNMQALAQLAAIDALASAASRNIHNLNVMSDALDVLVTSDRVSPKLIPPRSASKLWLSIASDLKRHSLPESPLPYTALYELPATYRFSTDLVEVGVHLPLIQSTFTLYHKLAHPIWLPEHPHPQVLGPAGYIAVAPDMRSFVRPNPNLASCTFIKTEAICPLVIDRTDWDQDCLASLFKGAIDDALAACSSSPFLGQWAAEQIDHDVFNIIVTKETTYGVVCSGRKIKEGQWRPGKHNVTLDEGCRVIAETFSLQPTALWQGTAVVAPSLEWISADTARRALKERNDRERAMKREAEKLYQQVAEMEQAPSDRWNAAHLSGGGVLLVILGTLAGAAGSFLVMKFKQKNAAAEQVAEH